MGGLEGTLFLSARQILAGTKKNLPAQSGYSVSDPRAVCRNTFLPETLETQSTGLEIAALVPEVGCGASQLLFNRAALARCTEPLMGRREGGRGGRASPLQPYPINPPQLDGPSVSAAAFTPLCLCLDYRLFHSNLQGTKKIPPTVPSQPLPQTLCWSQAPKKKKKGRVGKRRCVQTFAGACSLMPAVIFILTSSPKPK